MFSLENKVAIVTGAANGIGASIVKEFLKENVKHVCMLDIDDSSGRKLEQDLSLMYTTDKVKFYKCDVTKDEELSAIFNAVVERFGAIDVLVNNAGLATENLTTYKKEIDINYAAVVSSTFKALELMRTDRGGKGGTIINVSSVSALAQYSPFLFVYASSKSAVLHFSSCIGMKNYYRHTNVRVITICFGATDTDIFEKCASSDNIVNQKLDSIRKYTSRHSLMQTPEVAAQGVVKGYKEGKSGSTWLVNSNKISDITSNISKAYEIMSKI
ncbi:15-hydroxyprostaglandin dehydrogenase [NAD(+)]-like [Vanessa cardui]|uniref:15-hydroxyprostaglandin dehydrogenase [NAD(+)]-like n=1 Tax=Vanessa cardui TaxID=171605 RepID=UPI001F13D3B4|nr:15-hydroxyprostaglandin dehydrogenase [NAD(+)]-like [Vanessa cardui]